MTTLIDIDIEGGTLAEFDSTNVDGGDLSAAVEAALAGTGYGIKAVIDDTTAIYGQANVSPPASGILRYRFYFDPNSVTMASGDAFTICNIQDSATNVLVYWNYSTPDYRIRVDVRDDGGTTLTGTNTTVTDAPHYIEVLWQKATTSSSNDGVVRLWVDGVQVYEKTDVDIYNRYATITGIRIGATGGIDAGTSGTIYLDELYVIDANTEIGPKFAGMSVSDAVTVGETIIANAGTLAPAGSSDSAAVGETVGRTIALAPSKSDAVTVGESHGAALGTIEVSRSDAAAVADWPEAFLPIEGSVAPAVNDGAVIIEALISVASLPDTAVSDTATVADLPAPAIALGVVAADTLTADDGQTVPLTLMVAKGESVAAGESSAVVFADLVVAATDNADLYDWSGGPIGQVDIPAADGVTAAEAVALQADIAAELLDSLAVEETIVQEYSFNGPVSDAVGSITDAVVVAIAAGVNVGDTIGGGESVTVSIPSGLGAISADACVVGATAQVAIALVAGIADTAAAGEATQLLLLSSIGVVDAGVLAEALAQAATVEPARADTAGVGELANVATVNNVAGSESALLGDAVSLQVGTLAIAASDQSVIGDAPAAGSNLALARTDAVAMAEAVAIGHEYGDLELTVVDSAGMAESIGPAGPTLVHTFAASDGVSVQTAVLLTLILMKLDLVVVSNVSAVNHLAVSDRLVG